MSQERTLKAVSRFYIKNKDNREMLKKVRSVTSKIRGFRVPFYKNIFDTVHFRSYFTVLDRLSSLYKPSTVFEWGPGLNTELFVRNGAKVYSVEHHKKWYDFYLTTKHKNVTLIHSEISDESFFEYPYEILKVKEPVDIAFIDARCRAECIESCKKKGVPVVVMHDSLHFRTMEPATDGAPPVFNEQKLCKEGYVFYQYFIEVVDLRTIVLVDTQEDFERISDLFKDFYCVEGVSVDYDTVKRLV